MTELLKGPKLRFDLMRWEVLQRVWTTEHVKDWARSAIVRPSETMPEYFDLMLRELDKRLDRDEMIKFLTELEDM